MLFSDPDFFFHPGTNYRNKRREKQLITVLNFFNRFRYRKRFESVDKECICNPPKILLISQNWAIHEELDLMGSWFGCMLSINAKVIFYISYLKFIVLLIKRCKS
jgi:hypothetical protein